MYYTMTKVLPTTEKGVYTDDKPYSTLTSLFTFNGRDTIIMRD